MSPDEQDAILGRTMRELRDANERLERLRAEAQRRGARLEKLGHYLAAYPEFMVKEGEPVNINFSRQPQTHLWKEDDVFSADKMSALTSEIRKEINEVKALSDRLKKLGH